MSKKKEKKKELKKIKKALKEQTKPIKKIKKQAVQDLNNLLNIAGFKHKIAEVAKNKEPEITECIECEQGTVYPDGKYEVTEDVAAIGGSIVQCYKDKRLLILADGAPTAMAIDYPNKRIAEIDLQPDKNGVNPNAFSMGCEMIKGVMMEPDRLIEPRLKDTIAKLQNSPPHFSDAENIIDLKYDDSADVNVFEQEEEPQKDVGVFEQEEQK